MKTVFVLFVIGILWTGCKKNTIVDPGVAQWHYTAQDSAGTTIATGTMSFFLPDTGRFEGQWSLQKTGNPSPIGPQTGDGVLVGFVNDSTVSIDLNPNKVDDNVTLVADFAHFILRGKWMWVGYPGVLNEGTFTLLGPGYED